MNAPSSQHCNRNLRSILIASLASLFALAPAACSGLIDVPADCVPEDCGGHLCNTEKTECLFSCLGIEECADGYVCDSYTQLGDNCLKRSCEPASEIQRFFPGARSTLDVDGLWNGSNLGVAWVDGALLYFQTFDATGAATSDLVTLDAGSSPGGPAVAWTGTEWGVAWSGTIRNGPEDRETLRFARFDGAGSLLAGPLDLWISSLPRTNEVSVDQPDLAYDEGAGQYAAVWSSRTANGGPVVFLMPFATDGSSLDGDELKYEDGRRVASANDSTDARVMVRSAGVYDITYREGVLEQKLTMRTFSMETLAPIGPDVDLGLSGTGESILTYNIEQLEGAEVASFSLQTNTDIQAYRVHVENREIVQGEKITLGHDVEEKLFVTMASAGSEYASVFTGKLGDRREVFMVRYGRDAGLNGFTFPLTFGQPDSGPELPEVTRAGTGYFVSWNATTGENIGAVLGQYWTCE